MRNYELMEKLQGQVSEGTFVCSKVELAVPDKDFYFQRVLNIPLDNCSSLPNGQCWGQFQTVCLRYLSTHSWLISSASFLFGACI